MYINIDQLKTDANQPETFLNLLPDLTPVKYGNSLRFKESNGLSIYKHKNGKWILKNHSDKLNLPNGDVWNFTRQLHRLESKQVKEIAKRIAAAAKLDLSDYTTSPDVIEQRRKEKTQAKVIHALGGLEPDAPEFIGNSIRWEPEQWIPNNKGKRGYSPTIQKRIKPDNSIYTTASPESMEYQKGIEYFAAKGNIKPETLDKYGVIIVSKTKFKGYEFTHEADNFAYICKAGANVKRKQPFDKEFKEIYLQNVENYCFGWDQLPYTGEAVIIAAGESDTLAINNKAGETGIYAICLGSENRSFPNNLIYELKLRFESVIALYDNDKTGQQQSEQKLKECRYTRLDFATHIGKQFPDINDVCDAIQEYGTEPVFEWLQYIAQLKQLKSKEYYKETRDLYHLNPSIGHPEQWQQVRVHKYIDPDKIIQALKYNDRLLIDAPTGSGKTTAILQLAKQSDTRVIVAEPTITIAEDIAQSAEEAGIQANLIYGEIEEADYMAAINAPLFICTYDAIKNLNIELDILVIDEQHLLTSEYGYRAKALNRAIDAAAIADKVIYLSGTPDYHLSHYMNASVLKFTPDIEQRKTVNVYGYTSGNETGAAEWIAEIYGEGKHLIKKDNTSQLQAMQKRLKQKSKESAIFSNKVNTKQTPEYQRLINGQVNEDFILTTSLLETGVSILDHVESVNLLNTKDAKEIIQTASRPRWNGKRNKELDINLFYKGKAPTIDDNTEYTPLDTSFINYHIQIAEYAAGEANKAAGKDHEWIPDTDLNIRYSKIFGKYVVDILGILYQWKQYVIAKQNKSDTLLQLQAAGYIINDGENIELQNVKGEKKANYKEQAAEIFRTETADAIGAVKYHSRNRNLREKLKSIQGRNSERAKEIHESKKIYKYISEFTRRFVDIRNVSAIDRARLIELIGTQTTDKEYKLLRRKVYAQHCMKRTATGEAAIHGRRLHEIDTAIREHWNGNGLIMGTYKAMNLVKNTPYHRAAGYTKMTRREIFDLLNSLYVIEFLDDGNKLKFTETENFGSKNINRCKSGT